MKHFMFATVGDNCIDRFLPPLGMSLVGGNAVNVAVQLAELGHPASYFGSVGADKSGKRVRVLLGSKDVDVTHVRLRGSITAYTDLRVLQDGDREIVSENFGACDGYAPDDDERALLCGMRHVHLGWINDGGGLRKYLTERGVSVSQDVAVNGREADREVGGLSVAFASAGQDEGLGRSRLAEMLAAGAKCAVVTLGAAGSLASDGFNEARAGVHPVEVVDATGAGDSFIAGFLSAFVKKQPLASCLQAGSIRAAITCGHMGGFPQEAQPL